MTTRDSDVHLSDLLDQGPGDALVVVRTGVPVVRHPADGHSTAAAAVLTSGDSFWRNWVRIASSLFLRLRLFDSFLSFFSPMGTT